MTSDVGVIGMGAMGMNMALLLADKGFSVTAYNRPEKEYRRLEEAKQAAKDQGLSNKLTFTDSIREFAQSLKTPRKILIVISHGKSVDQVISKLEQYVSARDVIVDCGNEWYKETNRRIEHLSQRGILYLGMGVSGGYQAARQGPSMSPGGPKEAFDTVEPILKKIAPLAKGQPCYAYIGVGGSGHYVKMVHNGIEQGMMSAISEVYGIMRDIQKMSPPQISDVIKKWSETRELSNNYLVQMSAEICARPDEKNKQKYAIDYILDNVSQDVDSSEGTGTWTIRDAAARHMPCPTIVAAHFLRLTSAYRNDRVDNTSVLNLDDFSGPPPYPELIEDMRMALYTSHLCAFVEGFNLMARASKDEGWELNLNEVLNIYRAGCIIQSDYINELLQKAYNESKEKPLHNLFSSKIIADELARGLPALRRVVAFAVQHGAGCPALAATQANITASYSAKLITNMMQAQLDYFGLHRYTRTDEPLSRADELAHPKHHTEWRPALGARFLKP